MSEAASVLDFSAMEAPTLETTVETTAPETVETPPQQQVEKTGQEQTQEQTESGKSPNMKAIRDAVNAFAETNPEVGKHLKSLLANEGRIRAYQEVYPDVDSARSMKAAIEAAGGMDGLTKLSSLQDHVDDINGKWEAGDPAALETLFENPEGPVKLLPHYLNRSEKANPEAFGNAVRPHLVRSLEAANFDGAMQSLARLVADKPEAKEIVDSIIGWKNDQKRQGEKSNMDSLEPERKKLGERETQLQERERKQFEYEVSLDVKPTINQEFGKGMSSYLKDASHLSDGMKQDIAKAWVTELGKAMEKDKAQIETMMKSKSRNKAAIANYIRTRMSAVSPAVTKAVVERYKLTPGKGGPKPAGKPGEQQQPATGFGSSARQPIRVKERPADDRIDWDADEDRMFFMTGTAKLKDGSKQWVKWR